MLTLLSFIALLSVSRKYNGSSSQFNKPILFLQAYFPYFELMKVSLCDFHAVCVCLCIPLVNFSIAEPLFIKLYHGTRIHSYGVLPTFLPSVSFMYIFARQRLGRNITTATNAHTTITTEELLDASISMSYVLYHGTKAISYSQNFLHIYSVLSLSLSAVQIVQCRMVGRSRED
jgi:hypothetical protein